MRDRFRSSIKKLESYLPWYVNRTLTAAANQKVTQGLQENPELGHSLQEWETVQSLVKKQPLQQPSPAVQERLMARVRACNLPQRNIIPLWFSRAWGITLAITALLFLWVMLQPGVQLQWSVNQAQIAAFNIYRAPAGSVDFALLYAATDPPRAREYRFVDTALWNGRAHSYRIVALGAEGQALFSNEVMTGAHTALPGQLAVILTSIIIGYGAVMLIENWPTPPRRFQIC
ncbi:MAG: hypothetical protein RBT75_15755 [Anaerolineae bacterium]|nr:hypothetical protein [Anaerolineae bacterium]